MKKIIALFLALLSCGVHAAPVHRCAEVAIHQAKSLLEFHIGRPDERIEIDKTVEVLAPIRTPGNKKQMFDVLEVWGTIYKADYRMRLIYAQMKRECVLMGQEILEPANL